MLLREVQQQIKPDISNCQQYFTFIKFSVTLFSWTTYMNKEPGATPEKMGCGVIDQEA